MNKNDNNTRGHIGTELENKAETVLVISKNKQTPDISEVRPMHMRDKEFSSFAFHIDENAMPVLEDGYHVTVVKKKEEPLTSLPDETHKEILEKLFEEKQPTSYKELVAEMGDYYAAAGYKRGVNGVKNLLQILTNKNIITRSQNGYDFHPDYLNHVFHNDEDEV